MVAKSILWYFLTMLLGVCMFGVCNCATSNEENVKTDTTAVALVEENAIAEPVAAEEIFILVEQAPMFPGGEEARMKFISSNITYPTEAIIR